MDLDCKDGTCPIDGNKGNQTIRSGKSCLPCSGYKRYSTSNGFGKGAASSGRLPRDEKKTSIGTGSGTIRKDATTPSLPPPRGDVIAPERTTGPTGTTVGANGNPKSDVIRVGEGKGVVTGAATDGGASRPVSMPTANISGGTADAIGGTPARSGRASKGAIVTPAITDAVTTSSVIRTAAPTIPVVRMPSSSTITGLNIPKGVGREISINLPPSASAKQPRGDVVTPKQAAPFVLAPIAPLATQQPRPDYCDATGMNELIACQRGSDGTFPAVSSACAQSFRDLIARGLSVAEIISGNELCSDEFRRLLAGATPVLIEPPKQGAPVAAAKGMPLAVAAPTMIVAPGGAPTAVNPVQCMAMFLALPSAAQASIVGAYPCPQAQMLAPEIASGSRAAAADFVQWFGSAFRPESDEVSRFCAAVLNARGIAAAGAPSLKVGAFQAPRSQGKAVAFQSGIDDTAATPVDGSGYTFERPITIFGMPPYGRVFVDGTEVGGQWIGPQAWQVLAPVGQHRVAINAPDGRSARDFTVNVSANGAAVINYAGGQPDRAFLFAPGGAPGGIVVHGPAYVQPAGAAKGGMGAAIQSPRGYQGAPPSSGNRAYVLSRLGIAHMPPYGRVLIDGLVVEEGAWDRTSPSTWNVSIPSEFPHHVVVQSPSGEEFDAGYLTVGKQGATIDWDLRPGTFGFTPERFESTGNQRPPVSPLTSPGSTGTAVYNAKAAGAAKGGASMVLAGPNVRGPSMVAGLDGYFAMPFSIANMPPWGTVIVDGQVVSNDTDHWDRNVPTTWNVGISGDGRRHHVVLRSPSGEQRDAGYLTFSGPIMIDWNALRSVSPLTSPVSTGTAAYNAKAAGAPGGKSMVLAGPNARRPVSSVVTPTSQTIGENTVRRVNTSPSSVAPGVAAQNGAPSAAQCLQTLRAIASRDPRAIVAAFHQSGLDAIVPSRPGSGDSAADVLALIDDCAARRQQYPRQFDAFCRIAAALSGVKPGGDPVRPAGGNPPGTDMNAAVEQCIADGGVACERLRAPSADASPYQQCVDMGGVDCERLRTAAAQQPGSSGPSASQIIGGINTIATTGIGVLNSYLDRESAQHIEALRQNASSANAQIAANAQIEIARIQADAQARVASLGPNPSQQQLASVLNTATQPPPQGMSTGTTVAIVAGGAALVGGIAYLALSKKGR